MAMYNTAVESVAALKIKTQERDRNDLYFNLSTLVSLSPQCPPPPLLSFTSVMSSSAHVYVVILSIAEKRLSAKLHTYFIGDCIGTCMVQNNT